MVAAFFFYYNFKFKEYKFLDFNKIIQHLNIYEIPVVIKIKRYNKKLYKQDSPLEILK